MAQKVVLSAEKYTCTENMILSAEKLFVRRFSDFSSSLFVSLSLSLSLSISLSLSTSDPSPSPPSFLYLLLPPLSVPRPSSITLSFSLTFSVLGFGLDWGLESGPKPKLGFRV